MILMLGAINHFTELEYRILIWLPISFSIYNTKFRSI